MTVGTSSSVLLQMLNHSFKSKYWAKLGRACSNNLLGIMKEMYVSKVCYRCNFSVKAKSRKMNDPKIQAVMLAADQ